MNDAKQAGSVMTYLRRYGACQLLGIEGDDDDDAQVATMNNSYNNYKSKQPAAKQVPRQAQQAHRQPQQAQGQAKPVETTQPVAEQPKPETKSVVEPVVEKTQTVETNPVEQVETLQATTEPTEQVGQTHTTETKSSVVETMAIPKAPKRDMSVVFQSGLDSAKQFGATDEQLAEWQSMSHEEAIREMSSFVRDKASGK